MAFHFLIEVYIQGYYPTLSGCFKKILELEGGYLLRQALLKTDTLPN